MSTNAPHYLSQRGNWQAAANAAGAKLEHVVVQVISGYLQERYPDVYDVKGHPADLDQFYLEEEMRRDPTAFIQPTDPAEGDIWYDEPTKMFIKKQGARNVRASCGCIPDVRIMHKKSKRAYYVECKNQADAGNAHERAAKFATPSILEGIKRRLGVEYHPMGYIFSGELVRNRKYIYEIKSTYAFAIDHLLLWDPARPVDVLCAWVEKTVVPLLSAE